MLVNTRSNLHMSQTKSASLIRFAAAGLTVSGLLGISLPSQAITLFGNNSLVDSGSYRNCASRLLSAGVSPEAAAPACAGALNPQDVGSCVFQIRTRTEIAADPALASCRQVRRPIELSKCVVDISTKTEGDTPGVLNYCTSSLLPQRFADCVVGLKREIQLATNQAMETCISASDRPLSFEPTFIPASQFPPQEPLTPAPTSQQNQNQTPPTQPVPGATEPQNQTAPTEPQNQTPSTEPQNQTPPTQPAPAPTKP